MKIIISQEGFDPIIISAERFPQKYNHKGYNNYFAKYYVGTFCNLIEANSFIKLLNDIPKYDENAFIKSTKYLISHAIKSIANNDNSTLWNKNIKPNLINLYYELKNVFNVENHIEIMYNLSYKLDTVQNHGNIDYILFYKKNDKIINLKYSIRIINIDLKNISPINRRDIFLNFTIKFLKTFRIFIIKIFSFL